ncbi:aldehyde dehydrogenase family protein [Nocardioides sp. GXZ039]|uniref:aldehyde dehydrogenase family protein n=1 Tax=Nocardioides sp. GXZ039 TaxID=3136018 RepID=UPI0030F378C1
MSPQPAYQVTSPVDGEVLESFPFATDEEVEKALADAVTGQTAWADRPIEDRATVLLAVADAFEKRAEELGTLVTKEMGKKVGSAVGEAQFAAAIFRYYGTEGPALLADVEIAAPGADRAMVQRRPIGVVLGVMPWNYPYYQVARFAAPNLLVGNTVLIKHAENCPWSSAAIADVLAGAGVPAAAYANLYATFDQVASLIADPRVQGVSVTGSERAGAAVAEQAGRSLKKAVLELGGSDPYIVLDSDDVAASARSAWRTRMSNMGQACNSNKRMIVDATLHDDFVATLVAEAEGLEPGNPLSLGAGEFAPVTSRAAADLLAAQVGDAVERGAILHAGGTIVDGPGSYFRPAVLTGITPEMRIYHEEVFGPVAVVYSVDGDEEAVRLANDTRFGLGGAVFSTDRSRAEAVAGRLDVGMTHVNTFSAEAADMPFGGTKSSGFGRELGALGVDEFTNKRLYYVAE